MLELNHAVIPPPDLGLGLQPFNFRAIESADVGGGEVDYLGEGGVTGRGQGRSIINLVETPRGCVAIALLCEKRLGEWKLC